MYEEATPAGDEHGSRREAHQLRRDDVGHREGSVLEPHRHGWDPVQERGVGQAQPEASVQVVK